MAIGVVVLLAVEADVLRGHIEEPRPRRPGREARMTRRRRRRARASARAPASASARCTALDGIDLDVAPRRGAGAARRQRRGQVDADQVPQRRAPPRQRRDPDGRRGGRDPLAGATRARWAWRPSTRISRSSTTCVRPTTSSPAARSPGRPGCRARSACSSARQMTDTTREVLERLQVDPSRFQRSRRLDVRRTAAGRGRQPRSRVCVEGRDPRRADRGPRAARVAQGARSDPAPARARTWRCWSSRTPWITSWRSPTAQWCCAAVAWWAS